MSSGDERESDKWLRIVDEKTLLNISSVVPELLELRRTSIASRLHISEVVIPKIQFGRLKI